MSTSQTSTNQTSPKRVQYDKQGYCIFPKLIDESSIDKLLGEFSNTILPSTQPFFRQSSNEWEVNRYSDHGYALSSFLDIHDYPDFGKFSLLAKKIYCSESMRKALSELTGSPESSLCQSMFFDQNTATPPHQDYYYLDTVPNGHLLAAWIALEDIHEKAGRFYVIPGSQTQKFDLTGDAAVSSHEYVRSVQKFVDAHVKEITAPALKKGDVLFWNSHTVHGSLPTIDSKFSRKSLTAHYIPSHMEFGNFQGKPFRLEFGEFEGMKYRLNPKTYSKTSVIKFKIKNFLDHHPTMRRVVTQVKNRISPWI